MVDLAGQRRPTYCITRVGWVAIQAGCWIPARQLRKQRRAFGGRWRCERSVAAAIGSMSDKEKRQAAPGPAWIDERVNSLAIAAHEEELSVLHRVLRRSRRRWMGLNIEQPAVRPKERRGIDDPCSFPDARTNGTPVRPTAVTSATFSIAPVCKFRRQIFPFRPFSAMTKRLCAVPSSQIIR